MSGSAAELAHRLAREAEAVCRYYLSNGRRQGRYWLVGDVRNSPRRIVAAGIAHVIEGHRVFTRLTVAENLALAGYDLSRRERAARIDEALAHFPEIAGHGAARAGALSGGQQQMLAVAQGLVRRPRLLMLDEPSAGLSPVLVDRVLAVAVELARGGTAILLVEQAIDKALRIADRAAALARGRIVLDVPASDPDLAARLEGAYLGTATPLT